jgi:hypothetical protein
LDAPLVGAVALAVDAGATTQPGTAAHGGPVTVSSRTLSEGLPS